MQQPLTHVASPDRIDGEPAWEIAHLFPLQGAWTEEEYLSLNTNHLVELSEGRVEVLPIPTERHQMILAYLYRTFQPFVEDGGLGRVLFAGLPVRLWEGKIREPDLVVQLKESEHLRGNKFWRGADLAVEIVSGDDPKRDLKIKRAEYARAGIREYWIVDPGDSTIRVLSLTGRKKSYTEIGVYRRGDRAPSVLLPGLAVDVEAVFAQAKVSE